ncbi:hypothetical protein O6H91_15G079700 [Diphasiastrum complanatum]|uniref:Uncharacterized protein n=1 Tax=Diphasiastrum complanatum TaxID=34168 RepID=A0ACC2BK81_DIPCM|nr:hypothetical protein O6H91_15G079700 [Diphasiastrum complanatum]
MAYIFRKHSAIKAKAVAVKLFCFMLLDLLFESRIVASQSLNQDVKTLLGIKPLLGDANNPMLRSWNESNNLCSWQGVEWIMHDISILNCSSLEVTRNSTLAFDPAVAVHALDLGSAGSLNGILPPELGLLFYLRRLNVSNNNLKGTIPQELGDATRLMFIYLSNNRLNGNIPSSIWNLCNMLTELELDNNFFTGTIPSPASSSLHCSFLQKLHLNSNKLSGTIPEFLGSFLDLAELNLSRNFFTGPIPESLTQLKYLKSGVDGLNVAYNNLSGQIPSFDESFNSESFVGNSPSLCGQLLAIPCYASPAPAPVLGKDRGGPSPGAVAGIIIGVLVLAVGLLALYIGLSSSGNAFSENLTSSSLRKDLEEADAGNGKLVHFEGGEHLTSDDVLNATGEVLGKTSYGTVYKAKLSIGSTIALRLLRDGTVRDHDEFLKAIEELGYIRHQNLVPLRAFYSGHNGEKLLVYDYLPKGNLSDLLHSEYFLSFMQFLSVYRRPFLCKSWEVL